MNRKQENIFLFYCCFARRQWRKVLDWVKTQHDPGEWGSELKWIARVTKGKGARQRVIKIAFLETVYMIWRSRNEEEFVKLLRVCEHASMFVKNLDGRV